MLPRLFFCLVTALATSGAAAATPKFNVLFIISDDLRPELGCYGSPLARTPNIDSLAKSGVRFDRAYCQFPLCNPSRSSLLTGRQPITTGILGNRGFFRDRHPDFVSLPAFFKTNGYASLRSGKIFHGGIDETEAWTEGGEARGANSEASTETRDAPPGIRFAQYRVPGNRPGRESQGLSQAERSDRWLILEGDGGPGGDNAVADRTIAFLRKYQDKPFFLGCGFAKPHSPPTAPEKYYDMYRVDDMPLPPDFAPRPTLPEGFPRGAIRPRNADLFIGREATPQAAREMIRAYLASVSWMDWNVGRVLAELDKLGLREKTIVVFWGDHGYQLGEKGKWSKAGSLFEAGTRVPFVIAAPRAKGNGKTCRALVQSLDLYQTLAELCGLDAPKGLEGRSLVHLLNDPAAGGDVPAYTVWSEDGKALAGIAVRTDRWRYAEFDDGRGGAMLFDEEADPNEMKNLADDPKLSAVRTELSRLVKRYRDGRVGR